MLYKLKHLYDNTVKSQLQEQFSYRNLHQIPKLVKVVLNMGVGDATVDSKSLTSAVEEMSLIASQKPVITKAKKSLAAFKIREGMSIGCKVTLRRKKMYEFLERLVLTALPRVKDFRGFAFSNFDGRGNLNFGLKEQIVFMEIDYDRVSKIRGLDVNIVTSTSSDQEAKALLQGLYMPFIKNV